MEPFLRVIHPTGIFSSLEVVSIFNWHNRIYRTDNDFPCGIIFLEPMSKVDYVLRRMPPLLHCYELCHSSYIDLYQTSTLQVLKDVPWQSAQTGYQWWKLLYLIQRLSVSVQRGNACSFSAGNNSTLPHSNELLAFLFIFAFITQSIATFVLYILTVLIHMLPFTLTIE